MQSSDSQILGLLANADLLLQNWALYVIAVLSPAVLQAAVNLLTVKSWWDLHNSLLGCELSSTYSQIKSRTNSATCSAIESVAHRLDHASRETHRWETSSWYVLSVATSMR